MLTWEQTLSLTPGIDTSTGAPQLLIPAPAPRPASAEKSWSAYVQELAQGAAQQAEAGAQAIQSTDIIGTLKRNATAVYIVAGALFLLALMRGRR